MKEDREVGRPEIYITAGLQILLCSVPSLSADEIINNKSALILRRFDSAKSIVRTFGGIRPNWTVHPRRQLGEKISVVGAHDVHSLYHS